MFICSLTTLLFIQGCDSSKKVITFLAIDNSLSNVSNADNRKKSQEICKSVVKKQSEIDDLTLVEFNSDADDPRPRSLSNSNDDSRASFIRYECSAVAKDPPKGSEPGTDIRPTFQRQFEVIKSNLSSQNQSELKVIHVFVFSADALEGANYQLGDTKAMEFKSSVGKFLGSGNFLMIFINDDTDREKLSRFLKDFVTKYKERLYIGDAKTPQNYQKKISQFYAEARK